MTCDAIIYSQDAPYIYIYMVMKTFSTHIKLKTKIKLKLFSGNPAVINTHNNSKYILTETEVFGSFFRI